MNNIIIKKNWQDEQIVELQVTCVSDRITATTEVYSTIRSLEDLANRLGQIINGELREAFWECSEKGEGTTPYLSLRFETVDMRGHIRIEVFMELDDGGEPNKHTCCFYVKSELGLLESFHSRLQEFDGRIPGEEIAFVVN